MKTYDLIVIGSGSAGFTVAEDVRRAGFSVAMIEKAELGGECPNWACVPAKALIRCAKAYDQAKKLAEFGVHTSRITYRFSEIMARKDAVVSAITGDGKRLLELAKSEGIDVFHATAKFIDPHTIAAGEKTLKGKCIVIATGAADAIPPVDGLETAGYLDFRGVMQLKRKPSSVCIIGGGPVGCEFATFFSLLDTKVTMLQLAPTILHREDPEVAAMAAKALVERGVTIHVNAKALSVKKRGFKRQVTYQVGRGKRKTLLANTIIVAAGKRANVDGLNLKSAKVALDEKGRLKVKETLQTSQKHIFAAGDVSGGFLFTHVAHHEGSLVAQNVIQVLKRKAPTAKRDTRVVPRVTFVEPEVASVGLTPQEAADQKKKIVVGQFAVGALTRAVTENERQGLIKVVVDASTGKILGGHMVGPRAGEVIHEIALAMHAGVKAKELAQLIHAFPTFSESIAAAVPQQDA